MSRITVNFYLDTKPDKNGIRLILLYYSFNDRRMSISTKERIAEGHWDKNQMRVKPAVSGSVKLNARLANLRAEVEKLFEPENTSVLPIPQQVKDIVKSLQSLPEEVLLAPARFVREVTVDTFFEWIENFIKTVADRKPSTLTKYRGTFSYLTKFKAEVWSKKNLDFNDVNYDFKNAFVRYLQVDNKLSPNSIWSHWKNILFWMNASFNQEKHANLIYKKQDFKVKTEKSESVSLNEDEIRQVYDLELSSRPALDRVRDMFIIGCYTALRISDYSQVRKENINGNILRVRMTKTGAFVEIPIHRIVREILVKYHYVLPEISDVKFNIHIKEVARLTGIDQPISISMTKAGKMTTQVFHKFQKVSSHTARRSAATMFYNMGVPSLTIMAITGHKTEKDFLLYIKVNSTQHAQKLQRFFDAQEVRENSAV